MIYLNYLGTYLEPIIFQHLTHVKRELNSMADRLAIFKASPNRQLLPHRPDFTFQSLYRPHIPDNIESW